MATRFDGFYLAQYTGLNPAGATGNGVVVLKDGKVYGGDAAAFFVGEFEDGGNVVTARARVFPRGVGAYRSVTGIDQRPWDLPDIRGTVNRGSLPENIMIRLDAERYDRHEAITLYLERMVAF